MVEITEIKDEPAAAGPSDESPPAAAPAPAKEETADEKPAPMVDAAPPALAIDAGPAPDPGPDPEELKKAEEDRLKELIETAKEEIGGLKQENSELQRRVWTMQKKRHSINVEQFILEGQDARYNARLNNWAETKKEFERLKDEYDDKIDSLREKLQNKQSEAREQHEGMIDYIWKVARESADSISGRKIPDRQLYTMQQEERDTTLEMQAVRIRGRQLRSQLKKLEHALELKDQLPGGLHLVDFEQLKMENESLNEKIHLKNEDLSNLRNKTVNLVHTLTHVREKLQFVVQETKTDGEALAADDKTLHEGRIKLCEIKSACEAIKRKKENMQVTREALSTLQKNVVNITAPKLLEDMEIQKEGIEIAEERFLELKTHYKDLNGQIKKNEKFLPAASSSQSSSRRVSPRSRPLSPPLEHDPLRWGTRRTVLGKMVVSPRSASLSKGPSRASSR